MTHRKTWRVHTINTETSVDFSLDLVKEEAVDEHIDAGWMDGWMDGTFYEFLCGCPTLSSV